MARAFLAAVRRLQRTIDMDVLESALASGNADAVTAASAIELFAQLLDDSAWGRQLLGVTTTSGAASAGALSIAFDARDLNVILAAREQTSALVVQITDDVREGIRAVLAHGAEFGVTTRNQARILRSMVGLPPNWTNAPLTFREELLAGDLSAVRRRLSATDKAQIRKRIRDGTVDEAFATRMTERYASSLTNRRALNIAGTESRRAAHMGQRLSWQQGIENGELPDTVRRFWIVTPDDRLRDTHAAIPGMNPDGRRLDEPYDTPLGPSDGPPLETNCRCGEGLLMGSTLV